MPKTIKSGTEKSGSEGQNSTMGYFCTASVYHRA